MLFMCLPLMIKNYFSLRSDVLLWSKSRPQLLFQGGLVQQHLRKCIVFVTTDIVWWCPCKQGMTHTAIIPADNNQNPVTALGGGDNVDYSSRLLWNELCSQWIHVCTLVVWHGMQVQFWAFDSRLQVVSQRTGELQRSQPCSHWHSALEYST